MQQMTLRKEIVKILNVLSIKDFVRFFLDIFLVSYGYIIFFFTKATPYPAFQAFSRMFCFTRGFSNDFFSGFISLLAPKFVLEEHKGFLGEFDHAEVKKIADDILINGYHLFEKRLDENLCNRLLEFAKKTPCVINIEEAGIVKSKLEVYDPANPKAVRYYVPDQALIDNPDVQELISDFSLISIAQEYLGSRPILDHVCMWWSTAINKDPSVEDAQLFHFDLDRIRWLKFFIYLTDVTEETGPHCYIAKSHVRGGVPPHLFKRGYTRITDEELHQYYPEKDFIEFNGPRGMILAEDTRGFHKGRVLERGDRLLLQFQFTNSLFCGTFAGKRGRFQEVYSQKLQNLLKKYPKIFEYYKSSSRG